MKKILLTNTFFFIFLALQAQVWNPTQPSITNINKDDAFQVSGLGFYFGTNLSYLSNTSHIQASQNTSPKQGLIMGMRANIDLWTKYIKLSPEIFMSIEGTSQLYVGGTTNVINDKICLDYVGVALPLGFYIPFDSNGYSGFLVQGKYFVSYLTNMNLGNSYIGTRTNLEEDKGKYNYGYGIETGFIFNGMTLTVSYDEGISNIEFYNNNWFPDKSTHSFNTRVLSIKIGIVTTW